MALPKQRIVVRPESESRITDLSRKLIREADAAGILPTPLDRLYEIAKITNIEDLPDDSFLKTLSEKTRGVFIRAKQKLRGIADLRERVTYVPRDIRSSARERFVKSHELGHQVMPWHDVDPTYLDCDEQLKPLVKAAFEQEANFFGAETIFQGKSFRTLARDYQPNFDAVFKLADMHGASNQSTAWRFVEEQDEALALVQYYPGGAVDDHGNLVLSVWCSVGSPEFNRRFTDIDIPQVIRTGHSWVSARDLNEVCVGTENLLVDGKPILFQWHAWWNSYALLVLLRRKPILSLVGNLFGK